MKKKKQFERNLKPTPTCSTKIRLKRSDAVERLQGSFRTLDEFLPSDRCQFLIKWLDEIPLGINIVNKISINFHDFRIPVFAFIKNDIVCEFVCDLKISRNRF